MLLGCDAGGSGKGDIKKMRLMIVLFGGDMYCTLPLLQILIFDFYMILCSCQIVYLNNCPVVTLSFDRCTSILQNQDLSTYQINWPFRKSNIYQNFLIGQKDILSAKLSNEAFDFTLYRLVRCTPCKEQCALRYSQVFVSWILAAQLCTQNVGCQRKK